MVMEGLGASLKDTMAKIANARRIDRELVDEVVKSIQRAMLQADVNVKLVMNISNKIRERALKEKPPEGMSSREHVIRIVYQELTGFVGKSADIQLGRQRILMVGLQGSGKTLSTARLARYFQRKGLKPAVIAADIYRPGAYDQLKQLSERANFSFYGERDSKNAVKIVKNGLAELEQNDVIIIDTAGRHSLEKDLIREMKDINRAVDPDHRFLIMDAAIGQQASEQARAFHDAVSITGVIISKLDGTAKGGGALSAVAETGSPIAFIGTGETIEDFEQFEPDRFISRLLGMGDIRSLVERAEEALEPEDVDINALMRGKFTLKDMYKQLEALGKLGPMRQITKMLPLGGMGLDITDDVSDMTEEKLRIYRVIMDSMTDEELNNPRTIGASRIRRISMGSGTAPEDVRELLKYHKMMQNAMKGLRGGKMPFRKIMKGMKM